MHPDTEPRSPAPPAPAAVNEELVALRHIREVLVERPLMPGASEQDILGELVRLQDEVRSARADDRPAITQQIEHLSAVLDQVRSGRPNEAVDPDCPYFAHLRLEERGRKRDIYLGRATRLTDGLRIVDWRNAPVSKLFYRYEEGDEYAEEMGERVQEGRVDVRRTLHVQHGELLRVASPQGTWIREADGWQPLARSSAHLAGGQGTALRKGVAENSRLGAGVALRADKHLPDIAALIDPDQFALISRPESGVVVLRGSAGSGKTTVALHRIAYLSYNMGRRFNPQAVLVIVWGRAMRDYVANVLPALGVSGVQVSTWSRWARTLVSRHFPELTNRVAEDTPEPVTRLKLHAGVSALMERQIRTTPGKATRQQAIEDWLRLLTDHAALREAVGEGLSDAAFARAIDWCRHQVTAFYRRLEGERDADPHLDPEDDALLLRAHQLRVGPLMRPGHKPMKHIHVVLDEVQDFSPVEVQVLLDTTDERRSVTLAGDVRQHISAGAGFTSWSGFLARIGVEATALNTLVVSYRSTHPITRFALDVLQDDDEPAPRTTRDGPPVELFRFSDHGAVVAFLAEELRRLQRAEPNANVALLTPDPATSRMYAAGLHQAELGRVRLVIDQEFAFSPGIDVVEASQVKGLEFDYVVLVEASAAHYPDTPHHRRLLHVAATRAVHQLWLTCVGTPTSILDKAMRETG
jgi:DNA helicase-2/ATP-dependent DNA helicase PcrA